MNSSAQKKSMILMDLFSTYEAMREQPSLQNPLHTHTHTHTHTQASSLYCTYCYCKYILHTSPRTGTEVHRHSAPHNTDTHTHTYTIFINNFNIIFSTIAL